MYIIVFHNLFTGNASNVVSNIAILLKALMFIKQQNRQIICQNEDIL